MKVSIGFPTHFIFVNVNLENLEQGVHYIINPKQCTIQRKSPTKTRGVYFKNQPKDQKARAGVTSQLSQILHSNLDMIIIESFSIIRPTHLYFAKVSSTTQMPYTTSLGASHHRNGCLPPPEQQSPGLGDLFCLGEHLMSDRQDRNWNMKCESPKLSFLGARYMVLQISWLHRTNPHQNSIIVFFLSFKPGHISGKQSTWKHQPRQEVQDIW